MHRLVSVILVALPWSFLVAANPCSGYAASSASAESVNLPAENNLELTLDQAMQLAERSAFSARLAAENEAAADSRVGQARGALLPRVDLDGQKIWFSDSVNKLTGVSPFNPKQVTSAGVTVSQPIFGMAALLLQLQATAMLRDAASKDATSAKKDARLQGAEGFLRLQKADYLKEIARKSLDVSLAQQKEARALYNAGKINKADLLRFELALADARQQLSMAEVTVQVSAVSLAELLGTNTTNFKIQSNDKSFFELRELTLPSLEEALNHSKQERTELQNAEANIQIAQYYKRAGQLDFAPSLAAFARYERDFEAKATVYPPPPAPAAAAAKYKKEDVQDKFSYGLQLKWNLWDWGSRWSRVSEYEAGVSKAKIAKEVSESQVRVEVTNALLSLQAALKGLETSKTSLELSEEVYRLTKARFQSGQATSNDVISAERDQTRSRAALVNVRGDLDLAWLKLQKAMGKPVAAPLVGTKF